MKKFIRELRRREVLRTAGLYVGICWITIEVASVLLPTFDAPDWMLRAIVMVTMAGFPVMLVLAWVYNVTEHGIEVQGDPTDTVVAPIGTRKMDFAVIGVLSVALIVSVYLNFTAGPAVVDEFEPVSVLIADFNNTTGDELFDGTLEQALQIGIEGASFITGYRREAAKKLAAELHSAGSLDEAAARLVSVREGIKLVLAGAIEEDDGRYELSVRAIEPTEGEIVADVSVTADNKLEVLTAIGLLSGDLREELGDDSLDRSRLITSETFTAKSLEAAQEYTRAQALQYNGNYGDAIAHYQQAVAYDPDFGRAYSGWAVAARSLGRVEESAAAWEKALANIDTMTERERLRTYGMYYWGVSRNYRKAIESYETLVEKYPADFVGHSNLAVQYFLALDFLSALREGQVALEIYPDNAVMRSNFALFAMYASDFATAVAEAERVRELDPNFFKAWLPIAMKALSDGELEAARDAYRRMIETSAGGESTGILGLADIALYAGEYAAARELLAQGIAIDEAAGSQYFLATKYVALAEAYFGEGDSGAAGEALGKALEISAGESRQVPAALMYLSAGDIAAAADIAARLGQKLQPQSRAYALLIEALIALQDERHVEAIDKITSAIELADLWMLHFYLGWSYLDAGYFAEALDEFTVSFDRRGEATAVFLDDLPTYRYLAELPYWMGRAQEELGMQAAATENYAAFAARRPAGDPLADDARQRIR